MSGWKTQRLVMYGISRLLVLLVLLQIFSLSAHTSQTYSNEPATLMLEAEHFEFLGSWTRGGTYGDSSGNNYLFSAQGAEYPAVNAIQIPHRGNYTLWARTMDFPGNRPGERYCTITVAGRPNSQPFGKSGKAGWSWERGDVFTLEQGPVLLTINDNFSLHHSRIDAIILTSDPSFTPYGQLRNIAGRKADIIQLSDRVSSPPVQISMISNLGDRETLAQLRNEHLHVTFVPVTRRGQESVSLQLAVNTPNGWVNATIDPSSESYQVVSGGDAPPMEIDGFYPKWAPANVELTLEAGGACATTINKLAKNIIWNAGHGYEGIPRSVSQKGVNLVQLDFHPTPIGTFQALWKLRPSDRTIGVKLRFIPNTQGQYSLGYFLFNSKSIEEVEDLLMPMMVQRKRFPSTCYTLLQAACPTPVSLMQTPFSGGSMTWGVSADTDSVPFEFPVPIKSRFGMHIRNHHGQVHPSIYGPLIGTPGATANAGESIEFSFRILVQPGDWYEAYRTVSDDVFGWQDYRKNGQVSLTEAVLNMIDLYMDDEYGGWWERAKAPYQIESKNGSTHATPLTALSLYYLTGSQELYRRRTLPTLEFMLSRDGPHFSPIPENTGGYAKGSMNGPVDIFGTTVFGGLWVMSNNRTPAFAEIAFPGDGVRLSGTQQSFASHNQPFDEWLGRYLYTGDVAALDKSIQLADEYIAWSQAQAPTRELGLGPFFLMAYTPTWEGFVRLYEVTGHKRFLRAAEQGARLVMTGMWTQPAPVGENVVIHPNGFVHGDKMHLELHKGAEEFRLGWPIKQGDVSEKTVPGWLVSNVGLGFEQPITYTYRDNGGRLILQSPWSTYFLRLALYTGDKQFETYARNAVLGRFGNYPGYYYTTFTDVMQDPAYPHQGPDVGFFYYHHLPVHLSWTIDYLVSQAKLRSGGAIDFPGIRQFGYAYFDNLVYGHKPGQIMDQKEAWLWFNKDLVTLDNPQINYLTAHSGDKFFLIMMNENSHAETVTVSFHPSHIATGAVRFDAARLIGEERKLTLTDNAGTVTISARDMKVMSIEGLDIHVCAHQTFSEPVRSEHPGFVNIRCDDSDADIRAAAIQIQPGPWQAYVWSTAKSRSLKEIRLTYTIGGKSNVLKDTIYPYEFSVPVPAGETEFRFFVSGINADNTTFQTSEQVIGVADERRIYKACTYTSRVDALEQGFCSPPDGAKPHTWWHWMNGHVTAESITRDLEDMKRIGLGGLGLFNAHEGLPKGPVEYASEQWWQLLEHTMNEAERLGLEMAIKNGAGWSATGAAFVTPDKAMQEVAWTERDVTGPGKVKVKLDIPLAALGIERDMARDPIVNQRYYMPREHVEGYFRDIAVFAVPSIPQGQTPWRLSDWRKKAGFGKMAHRFDLDNRTAPADQVIGLDQVLDISSFMDKNGILDWTAPEGNWTILRIGYQPTGRNNHPASYGGRGLEIDKMSSEAVDFYWENFLDRVVKTGQDRIDEIFYAILIDSFEVGHQNWNRDFAQSFMDAKGYDFRMYLPAVTGRVIESAEFTERILWDFRKVIGDRIAENYYGRMAQRAAQAGLRLAAEPLGDYGNTNDFVVAGKADIPLCEWWAYLGQAKRTAEAKMAASAAHTYGGKIVDAEAFTGQPDRIFESYPGGIKSQGDFFMTRGVNRFSFHTWVHDPYNIPPGFGLGSYGSRFDSRNTWWAFSRPWHVYLSRCFYLLQQGEFIGDVLYYVGQEAPLQNGLFQKELILTTLPEGYDYAFCNPEILQQLKFDNGRLKTENGSSFRILVLPDSPWMSLQELQKIYNLLEEGAVIVGPRPSSLPGRFSVEEKARFDAFTNAIWGRCNGKTITSHAHGKGSVYWGKPLDEVLNKYGIVPDFTFIHKTPKTFGQTLHPNTDVEFIHRRIGSDEIYFLSNQHQQEKTVLAKFRVTGKRPEVWSPDSGKRYQLTNVRIEGRQTEVVLHFEPEEAYFVVFRESESASAGETVPWLKTWKVLKELNDKWSVTFQADEDLTILMPELISWTMLDNEIAKYHSGTALYQKGVVLQDSELNGKGSVFLDLGNVEVIAKVFVNNIDCGIAWKKPYRVDVTKAMTPGENTIEVTVANLWVNRIVGDQQYPDGLEWTRDTGSTATGKGLAYVPDWVKNKSERPSSNRKTFYAWKWPHMEHKALLPSGLIGPVRLLMGE